MAKVIKYKYHSKINHGTEESPMWVDSFADVEMGWNEINEETAKREAYNGEYTIEDDGQPEPEPIPSTEDLEAENEDMRNALGVLGVTV